MAKYQKSPLESGRLRITGPVYRPAAHRGKRGVYVVTIADEVLEDEVTKEFATRPLAEAYIANVLTGMPSAHDTLAAGSALAALVEGQQCGPQVARIDRKAGETVAGSPTRKINLRAVREVLEEYGLDPTAEVAAVLLATEQDGKGNERHVIRGVDRAKIVTELMQYVSPKLKSVEMKVKDERPMSDAELDERIKRLQGEMEKKQ